MTTIWSAHTEGLAGSRQLPTRRAGRQTKSLEGAQWERQMTAEAWSPLDEKRVSHQHLEQRPRGGILRETERAVARVNRRSFLERVTAWSFVAGGACQVVLRDANAQSTRRYTARTDGDAGAATD